MNDMATNWEGGIGDAVELLEQAGIDREHIARAARGR